jgi:hypothetical protein
MDLDTFEYAAGISGWNGAGAKRGKQQRFPVRDVGCQEMSCKARIDPIDAGGRLSPEPE